MIQPRSIKSARLLLAMAYWLIVGAILNVAAAWGIAAFLPQRKWSGQTFVVRQPGSDISFAVGFEYSTIGAMRRTWQTREISDFYGRDLGQFALGIDRPLLAIGQPRTQLSDSWGDAPHLRETTSPELPFSLEHATGWPMLSAWYTVRPPFSGGGVKVVNGIPLSLPSDVLIFAYKARALPCAVIWRGCLFNTCFYSTTTWVFWRLVRNYRTHRRLQRNACVYCAYDRSGIPRDAPCPECGQTL